MASIVEEKVKEIGAQEPVEKPDTDGEGAPTEAAASQELTTAEATGEAIAENKDTGGANIAAEALLPEIDRHVAEAEVTAINKDTSATQEAQKNLVGTGAIATSPHVPTEELGRSNIVDLETRRKEKDDAFFPSIFDTGDLAKGSGKAANEIETKKNGLLTRWREKLLGGTKIVQAPSNIIPMRQQTETPQNVLPMKKQNAT